MLPTLILQVDALTCMSMQSWQRPRTSPFCPLTLVASPKSPRKGLYDQLLTMQPNLVIKNSQLGGTLFDSFSPKIGNSPTLNYWPVIVTANLIHEDGKLEWRITSERRSVAGLWVFSLFHSLCNIDVRKIWQIFVCCLVIILTWNGLSGDKKTMLTKNTLSTVDTLLDRAKFCNYFANVEQHKQIEQLQGLWFWVPNHHICLNFSNWCSFRERVCLEDSLRKKTLLGSGFKMFSMKDKLRSTDWEGFLAFYEASVTGLIFLCVPVRQNFHLPSPAIL